MPRRALRAVALLLAATTAGSAATLPAQPPLPPVLPVAPPPPKTLPPYQDNLERLADVLGILAFMRDLCGAQTGPDWRAKMAALVQTEGVTEERRARLAGRFNQSYQSYGPVWRTCTPAARAVVGRALAEGAQLSSSLAKAFDAE